MNFLDLKPDRIDEVNEMITLAKSEEIVWERFVYIYQNDKLPDENTMCALMDYYVEDLHTVKKIYRQMELGITKNLKAVLDGDSLIDNQQNGIKIEHTKLSRISLLNALIAARDLEGVYEILEEFRMDPSVFSKLQEFKTTDSLNYIKLVADLFDLAKDNGSIDTFQALEPKIQYTVAKQDYKKSSILIQNYLEGRDGVIKSPKMQPIILNYYLKRNEHQKAFELFLDCNPKIKLECIPHLMATLTKLDDNPGSGYSKSEVFEMVQFVWNVYIFLLKSGNSFKEYFRLQRTLQHTLRYFVRAENEEYADKVLFHALNNSVRIDLQLLAEYGAFKLKISGNVWTHLLIPTLAYPQPCLRDDPFKKYENSTLTLESTGLLPEDLYDDNEGFFDFPYVIKPEIEADLIEVLLLTFGMSVNVDYTNSKTKISTSLALKSFYNSVKSSADQKVIRLFARLSVLKNYDDLIPAFVQDLLIKSGRKNFPK